MGDAFTGAIRFLHILSGVAMVGGVLLWGGVLMPAAKRFLKPEVRGPFMSTMFPRVSGYLTWAGVVAIVTGLWTMGLIAGFDGIVPAVAKSTWGLVLAVALVVVLVVMAIGWLVIKPAGTRLLALAAAPGGPPPEEAARLQKRLAVAGVTNVLLSVVVLALMAAAVNIRA